MPSNPLLQTSSTLVGQEAAIPYDNEGAALAKAGESLVDTFATLKTTSIQNDVQAVTDEAIATAAAANAANKGPLDSDVIAKAIGGTADQVDDPDNAVIRPVLESIARLKRANEQGTINVDEVKIRQENILRAAIARHPTFAARFIQGASQQLGYNPIGSTIDALAAQGHTGKPKTQADEIEDYYEKQGDLLNVDRTLKYSNPAAWYSKVQKEIGFNANLAKTTREYQLKVTTRQSTEEVALNEFRTKVMPNYGRQTVKDLLIQAQHFVTMSPEQRNLAISRGELDQLRTQIGAAKLGLYDHINRMNGSLENFLTRDQINEGAKDVLAQLEYAEKATDPVAALQGIKTHLEAVVMQNVDFKYPDFGTMERVTKLLSNIPNDSLIAKKYSEEMSSALAMSLNNMVGGIINNKDPKDVRPMSVVPFEVSPNMSPAQRAQVTQDTMKGIGQWVHETPNDPIARRATVRTLGAFATEYNNTVHASGKAPDADTAQQFIDLAASDDFKKIVTDPNVDINDMAMLTGMNEVMAAEAMDTAVEIGQDIKSKFAPTNTPQNIKDKMSTSPYAGYDPEVKRALSGVNIPLSEVVHLEWQNDRVVFVTAAENDSVALQYPLNRAAIDKQAQALTAKYGRRLTSIVRATAHSSGSDDYSNSTVIVDNLFSNVRFSLPE